MTGKAELVRSSESHTARLVFIEALLFGRETKNRTSKKKVHEGMCVSR